MSDRLRKGIVIAALGAGAVSAVVRYVVKDLSGWPDRVLDAAVFATGAIFTVALLGVTLGTLATVARRNSTLSG